MPPRPPFLAKTVRSAHTFHGDRTRLHTSGAPTARPARRRRPEPTVRPARWPRTTRTDVTDCAAARPARWPRTARTASRTARRSGQRGRPELRVQRVALGDRRDLLGQLGLMVLERPVRVQGPGDDL